MLDPLSDVLSHLEVRFARCKRLEAGGDWAIGFPAKAALKFAAVLKGESWIAFRDDDPVHLVEGDTLLLANAPGYVLASDVKLTPQDGFEAYDAGRADNYRIGDGGTVLIGAEFTFEAGSGQLLLDALPNFMHVPRSSNAAILRATLMALDVEIKAENIGRSLMIRRMADIALVQVLRAYIAENGPGSAKWVGALTDERIARALSCIHQEPGRAWTVQDLAKCAGMSRSGFAAQFRELVGTPPLQYLMSWRMECARQSLRRGKTPLRQIASRAGYASESAFGFAFKRTFGFGPRQYRRNCS